MDLERLCPGCMSKKPDDNLKCAECGFVEGTLPDSPLFLPPRTVLENKYLIGRVLGQGGFGITYLAWDLNLNVKLAIKEYFPQELASRAAGHSQVSAYTGSMGSQYDYGLDKFLQEARTLAQFEGHPNIVSVRDFFKANGTAYFVMSYVEGITVKDHLAASDGLLPPDQARSIIVPVMDALKEVHAVGILHRDVSPDNIFINKKGQVILIDFGAARQAIGEKGRSLSIILKPGYAPEEQYRTKGVQGPWTDIYAIAATYYHLLTGKQPPEALERLLEDPLEPPTALGVNLSEEEEGALLKALSVRAEERFQNIQEFLDVLLGITPLSVSGAGAEGRVAPVEKPAQKTFPKGLVFGLLAVLVVAAAGYGLWTSGLLAGGPKTETAEPGSQTLAEGEAGENSASASEDNQVKANLQGNSSGNINNGGLIALQGETYYFRSNHANMAAGLYGGDKAKTISADSPWFINVSGDYIYYSNRDDNNRLYRLQQNGSDRKALTAGGAWFVTLEKDFIYYLDEDDDFSLYRVNLEGEDKKKLSEDLAWELCVKEDWLYYTNRSDGDKIYRLSTASGQSEKLGEHPASHLSLSGDHIYYSNETDNSFIYKMKLDGSADEKILERAAWFINVSGDYIYYADEEDGFSLHKVKTDGSESVKLVAEAVRYINVVGEFVIYMDQAEEDTIYKVYQDGTARHLLEAGFYAR